MNQPRHFLDLCQVDDTVLREMLGEQVAGD